jgi:hypothetical protein
MTQDTQEAIRKLKELMEALKKQAQSKEPEPKLPQEQKVKEGDHGVLTELYPDMEMLGKLFSLAKAIDIDEVTIYIRDDGLITNFMDRTHVMLVDMKMTWQLFSKSEFQKGVIDHFTLRTNETINLLKRLEEEDVPICVVIDPSKLNEVSFRVLDEDRSIQKYFTLYNADGEDRPLAPAPRMHFDTVIDLLASDLKKAFSRASSNSRVQFIMKENVLSLVQYTEEEKFETKIQPVKIDRFSETTSTYSYEIIRQYVRSMRFTKKDTVNVSFARNMPVLFSYYPSNPEDGYINFWLAPIITE